jgi:hypothetical protein
MNRREYREYEQRVAEFFEREGLTNLTSSPYKCPDCDVPFECNQCPQCGKDGGQFPVEAYPSRHPCDCCGDPTYGNRLDANEYSEKFDEAREYVICEDCDYYAEYGHLDDQTMAQLDDK